jgi:hypothetical protein
LDEFWITLNLRKLFAGFGFEFLSFLQRVPGNADTLDMTPYPFVRIQFRRAARQEMQRQLAVRAPTRSP